MKLRKTLRIARWEVSKNAGQLDRRTLAVAAVVLVLVAGLTPLVAQRGVTLDDGIYRVGVSEDSPYHDVVTMTNDSAFVAVEPNAQAYLDGEMEVLIQPGQPIVATRTPKGQAALSELRKSVERYNDRQMTKESDRAAAFPVNVSVVYADQNTGLSARAGASGAGSGASSVETRTTREGEMRLGGGGSGGDGSGSGGETGGGAGGAGTATAQSSEGGSAVPPSVGDSGGSLFGSGGRSGTPADIAPPFPFESLVLAFAFILPMNFVIQAYASSVMDERINDRGELLLVSPVSRGDIIAGKTLPYFAGMVGIASVTALGIAALTPAAAGGPLAVAATALTLVASVVPIAALFLACAFVGAMFARSFKELTFVTVSLSVFLTAYAFVPAIFTDVHPVAAISPLTLVVRALQGEGVPLGDYAFSTLPLFLTAGVLFALGAGVYREEDMFTQRSVPLKFLDALDGQISGKWSVAKLSALSIPFVFVGELLVVALLFALPVSLSMPALLVAIAFVEEVAKSVGVYAGFAHARFDRTPSAAVVLGALSGLGFFVGEKATAVAQLVGLPNLELGRAAFGTATGLGLEASPLVLVGLFLAPLALHAVTAAGTAVGASKGREWYFGALLWATLVHAAYNLTVVTSLG
ncbi:MULTISPECIES: ABC transporter permease subunit [Halorussus]|uniref:ABC transporter permease subunit n=1 Tax=Halorussus TaxID=1070314 RepID=UPI00209D37E1|nr:ABC transporter permease subunit [Halorussus vallis]USZ75804.1 ABC transporter permease subunit [Halorussus vallis]